MLAEALKLAKLGYWVVAIRPGEKRPIGKAWGAERWAEDRLRHEFKDHPGAGMGICLGPGRAPKGRWLVDIEGDGERACDSLERFLAGEIADTMSWSSTRGVHHAFTVDGERLLAALRTAGAKEGKGEGQSGVWNLPEFPDLEFRIGGRFADGRVKQAQSIVPPTRGTDGQPRKWIAPPSVGVATLPESSYTLIESLAKPARPPAAAPGPRHLHDRATGGDRVEGRAIAYLAHCDPAVSGQRGHDRTFGVVCRVGPGFDLPEEVALRLIRDHWNPRCEPPWSEAELRHKVADAYRAEADRGWLLRAERNGHTNGPPGDDNGHIAPPGVPAPAPAAAEEPTCMTDMGNARRLVTAHGRDIRFCHPWEKWLVWKGQRWSPDDRGTVHRHAKDMVMAMNRDAREDGNARLLKWSLDSQSRDRVSAAIALARSEPGIPVVPDDLNADPWLLNVLNGTIDLRAGELRDHRREDLMTNMAPVEYAAAATCPLWESIQSRIFGGNDGLIRFWRQLCGLSLTGVVGDQILPILYGAGANGKSTILGALQEILGPDYAITAPPGLLVVRRNDGHPTERAILHGKRLVVDMESAEGARMNEAMVKQLTGSDRISARRMREDFWDFAPTHKIMLVTNHKPEIRETKNAIWRRIKLIPFTVSIPEEEQIRDLPERLRNEYPGILAWCVRGCLDWQRDGLTIPSEVTDATREYQNEQDVFGEFISEECVIGANYRSKASQLYERYRLRTEGFRETSMSQTAFGIAMRERGFRRFTNNGTWYEGIGLRSDDGDDRTAPY